MISQSTGLPTLREMAIFLDCLDRKTADDLLESLPDLYELQLRDAMVELEAVSTLERETVSASVRKKFVSAGLLPGTVDESIQDALEPTTMPPTPAAPPPSQIESKDICEFPILSKSGSDKLAEELPAVSPLAASLSSALDDASIDSLVKILRDEHPQTLAVVMATLPPVRAASFLRRFRSSKQAEILRRVAEIEEADPMILEEMQQELIHQLTRESDEPVKAGLHMVHSIISATPTKERAELLTKLADSDHELARSLSPRESQESTVAVSRESSCSPRSAQPPVSVLFDRFVDLDRLNLIEVFSRLPTDVAALALAGASQPCLADVLERLPSDLSQELREGIREIGPLRLSDIQSAQQAAVSTSREVLAETQQGFARSLKLSA